MPIPTFLPALPEEFDAAAYYLANPDVERARVDARDHLLRHGLQEGRLQVNRAILAGSDYRRRKFERFETVIAVGGSAFPLHSGGRVLSLSEYQSESANEDFPDFVREADANPDRLYLDLGCGLRRFNRENVLYLEVYPSITADLVVDPTAAYPIRDSTLDGIGCFAVLEHTRRPWVVVEEIARMLKPGGKAFIDWPFLQPVHGYPSHYYNATREGLVELFSGNGFEINQAVTGWHQTPDHTLTWIVGKFMNDLPEPKRREFAELSVGQLVAHPPGDQFWINLLAGLPDHTIAEFACGNSMVATKK